MCVSLFSMWCNAFGSVLSVFLLIKSNVFLPLESQFCVQWLFGKNMK